MKPIRDDNRDQVGDGIIKPSRQPNAVQRLMIDRKYGMFIHFGINTFHDEEWTDGTKPASSFAPGTIDTDPWAATARDAGMRYVILTAKHHDGFCLWNSRHTDYGIVSGPGKPDVVASLAGSCRKYGIELGLYYSLWDRHWGNGVMRDRKPDPMEPGVAKKYVGYMKAQLKELLTGYDDICELWLDGGWVQPRDTWRIDEVYSLVKKRQPACAVGINHSIGFPDNPDATAGSDQQKESYPIRYFPGDFRLIDPHLPVDPDPKLFSHDNALYYLPFETTVCLNQNWFFNTSDAFVKTLDALESLYRRATAQDNVLILNSPPNREGRMTESNARRLAELAGRLNLRS
jgi:alpha-L-fucosidase